MVSGFSQKVFVSELGFHGLFSCVGIDFSIFIVSYYCQYAIWMLRKKLINKNFLSIFVGIASKKLTTTIKFSQRQFIRLSCDNEPSHHIFEWTNISCETMSAEAIDIYSLLWYTWRRNCFSNTLFGIRELIFRRIISKKYGVIHKF